MSSKTLLLLATIVVIAVGIFLWQKKSTVENNTTQIQQSSSQTPQEETKTPTQSPTVQTKGSYEAYSPEKISKAAQGKVVLFFHAGWCPTCRQLDADIQKNVNEIPNGVTILKTDYDSELALRQKYGVTYQHTLVQVDANGNLISKWSGSPTLSEFLEKVI